MPAVLNVVRVDDDEEVVNADAEDDKGQGANQRRQLQTEPADRGSST